MADNSTNKAISSGIKLSIAVSDFITGGRISHLYTIGEVIFDAAKITHDERAKICLDAISSKLNEHVTLSKEDITSLIDKDNTNFIVDILTQAMQTQSQKLQIALGLIYSEYLNNNDNKTKQSEYLRLFNAVKQMTESDFDVFYHIMQFFNDNPEPIKKGGFYQFGRNHLNNKETVEAYLINQTGYDFDLLEISCHQLITTNFFLSDTRGALDGGGVQFQVINFSRTAYKLFKKAEIMHSKISS